MDSLTISPSMLRRANVPEELLLGETMFDWSSEHHHSAAPLHHQPLSLGHMQQTLSPPEMDMVMGTGKMNHHHRNLQTTPVRQRAMSASMAQYSDMMDSDKGLVTPISIHNTPGAYWTGQKLEFMTPNTREEYATVYNTPLATPVPLMPCSPLYEKSLGGAGSAGTNPFYNPPMCMRRSVSPPSSQGPSPNIDMIIPDKLKAASAAEEALANFSEPQVCAEPQMCEQMCEQPIDEPDKPFACSHCTKAFRRMEHLRRHIKIHTKERPFSCEIPGCGRMFSRNDNLKAHMKTHAKPSGRNIYVEGLEIQEVQATPKRRRVQ